MRPLVLKPQTQKVRNSTQKTPVREALARLSGEGFVIGATNRRTLVAPLSAETTREVYSIRLMLEPASLRTVAAQLSADDLDRLLISDPTSLDTEET